ncbi:MAG: tetratricopeptide repeat protein [Flavobacteriales bacterium]|nr:tetratricopeptide repeat protein [Flavobacteriales bacterium]
MIQRFPLSIPLALLILLYSCVDSNRASKGVESNVRLTPKDSVLLTEYGLKVIYHFDQTGDLEIAGKYLDSAKHLLDSLGLSNSLPMSSILNLEAVYWQRRYNDRDTAIAILNKALKMTEDKLGSETPEVGDMLTNLGFMYMEKRDFGRAETLMLKALSNFSTDTVKYAGSIISAQTNLGTLYEKQEKYEMALPRIYSALDMSIKAFGDEAWQTLEILGHLASIYHNIKDHDQSLEYRLKVISAYEAQDPQPKDRLRTCYNNLGLLYSDMGLSAQAMDQYKKAEPLYEGTGGRIATLWDNMASELKVQGDLAKAIAYHEKAQALEIEHYGEDDPKVAKGRLLLANAYNDAGRYADALEQLQKALKSNRKLFSKFSQKMEHNHRNIAETYLKLGQVGKAYSHLDSAYTIRDSVSSMHRISSLTEMAEKYESEKKENEIAILTLENERKQAETLAERRKGQLILGGSILLVLILVGGGILINRNRKARHREELARRELQTQLIRTDLERIRLTPHFIKNALTNVEQLISVGKAEEAQRYTERFNRLMNRVLTNSRQQYITLAEELEMMRDYLSLEADRVGNSLEWRVNVTKDVDIDEVVLPPMILQPLLENALKYGADLKSGKGEVKLNVRKENDRVICSIEDNGQGIDIPTSKPEETVGSIRKTSSNGLRITRERLQLFSDLRKTNAELDLQNTGNGTRAVVSFSV